METCTEIQSRAEFAHFRTQSAYYFQIPFWGGNNNEIAAGYGWWFVNSCD